MEAIKAGTWCECRDVRHANVGRHNADDYCGHDAVRLVKILVPSTHPITGEWLPNYETQIPMCAACAEYHESKGA
jgi:hypothetical protein